MHSPFFDFIWIFCSSKSIWTKQFPVKSTCRGFVPSALLLYSWFLPRLNGSLEAWALLLIGASAPSFFSSSLCSGAFIPSPVAADAEVVGPKSLVSTFEMAFSLKDKQILVNMTADRRAASWEASSSVNFWSFLLLSYHPRSQRIHHVVFHHSEEAFSQSCQGAQSFNLLTYLFN